MTIQELIRIVWINEYVYKSGFVNYIGIVDKPLFERRKKILLFHAKLSLIIFLPTSLIL